MAASTAFDLFIAGERLPDGNGLSLLDEKDNMSGTPLVLVDDQLDGQRTLAALRRGALDVLTPPIELDRLLAIIRRAVKGEQSRQRREARAKRLRRLSSRLISDRRELRQRVDLICRDLVEAYRRLAQKVTTSEDQQHFCNPPRPIDSFTSEA
jgi:DNA-binding NtrC family response regulator